MSASGSNYALKIFLEPGRDYLLSHFRCRPAIRLRKVKCEFICLFIWVLTQLLTHCIGHITTGSFIGRRNQYIRLVKVLYCKLPSSGKQLPAFPLEVRLGFEFRSQEVGGESVTTMPPCPLQGECYPPPPCPSFSNGIKHSQNLMWSKLEQKSFSDFLPVVRTTSIYAILLTYSHENTIPTWLM